MAQPLNHARIQFHNLIQGIGFNGAQQIRQYTPPTNAVNVINPEYAITDDTYNVATFNGTSSVDYDFPTTDTGENSFIIDTVCIGATNIRTCFSVFGGGVIRAEYKDPVDGLYYLLAEQTLGSSTFKINKPVFLHIENFVTAEGVRIIFQPFNGTDVCYIGNISAGISMQMRRPFFGDYAPAHLSAVTKNYSATTESGEWVSRDVQYSQYETSASWSNLPGSFIRGSTFRVFIEHARRRPFYMAWNILQFPDDVIYCSTMDVKPAYSGTKELMSLALDLKVHG